MYLQFLNGTILYYNLMKIGFPKYEIIFLKTFTLKDDKNIMKRDFSFVAVSTTDIILNKLFSKFKPGFISIKSIIL